MKASGKTTFIELTPTETAAWHKALDPVAAEMTSRIGKETIDAFRQATSASN